MSRRHRTPKPAPALPRSGVAPHDACVRCFKGDVTTGVALAAFELEWIAGCLIAKFGFTEEVAMAMVGGIEKDLEAIADGRDPELGLQPDEEDRLAVPFRLCRDCAEECDTRVGEVGGGEFELPCYRQKESGSAELAGIS